MNILNMQYNKMALLDENKIDKQRIYLEKTRFNAKNIDHFFIKLFKVSDTGQYMCQGYIYFYISFLNRESNFIGLYINPEYRNEGLAQVLISQWIKLCLDNGLYNLNTTWKQRKPFLIYLLKKFKFDLMNIQDYEISPNTISICRSFESSSKYLFFKNHNQAETFKNGTIQKGDNYVVLDSLSDDIEVVDQVLLSTLYESKEEEFAYTRSLKLIDGFNKK